MASSRLKNLGISTYKLRLVIEQIKGKTVINAVNELKFMKSPAAKAVRRVLESAIANAENNDLQNRESLKITQISADKSTTTKRFRAKARGRAGAFDRPSSHITVEVDETRVD